MNTHTTNTAVKNSLFALLLSLFIYNGFAQEVDFQVKGRYLHSITSQKLSGALLLSDFIDGYPSNWITNYVSVEVSADINGNPSKAMGGNEVLTDSQKNILTTATTGTDIEINVKYNTVNGITNLNEVRTMHMVLTVIPETEAQYTGGNEQMKKYLKANVIEKMPPVSKEFQQGKVLFTVSEAGEIVNTKISKTSGDAKTDKLMIEAINKMPKWKPAENAKGIKVAQEFEFGVGRGGC